METNKEILHLDLGHPISSDAIDGIRERKRKEKIRSGKKTKGFLKVWALIILINKSAQKSRFLR